MTAKSWCILFWVTVFTIPTVQAEKEWTWDPAFRYRTQSVGDEFLGDAVASTFKGRLTTQYLLDQAWSVKASIDHVHVFNEGRYNNIVVHRPTSPIPDPPGTELSELSVLYRLNSEWALWGGRLPLVHDNERHVGTQEFWQKRQTVDGVQLQYDTPLNTNFSYTYLNQVNRFFGRDAKQILDQSDQFFAINPVRHPGELGVHRHNSHLLHGRHNLSASSSISAYFYALNNESLPILSSDTLGLKYQISVKPDKLKYELTFESAIQQDGGNNTSNYQAAYVFAEIKMQYKSHQLGFSHEHLGADNQRQFATSLGSNHNFQGWADVFAGYGSTQGLNDSVISYGGRDGRLRWKVNYHLFFDKSLDRHLGKELDIEVAYRFNRQWEAKFALAKYNAENRLPVTRRTQSNVSTLFYTVSYNL